MAYEILNKKYKTPQVMSKFGVRLLGLFVPVLREFVEMMYQFENEYVFDSSKAEKAFNVKATSYMDGITETLK